MLTSAIHSCGTFDATGKERKGMEGMEREGKRREGEERKRKERKELEGMERERKATRPHSPGKRPVLSCPIGCLL